MRGSLRHRGNPGSWEYRIDLGLHPALRCDHCRKRFWMGRRRPSVCPLCGGELRETLERKQLSKGEFATKTEAESAMIDTLAKLQRGSFLPPDKTLTVQYFRDIWLPSLEGTVRPTTLASYTAHVNHYIIPRLGSIPLRRLDPTTIQSMYADLRKNGRVKTPGPLAPNSVRRIHATLHRALKDAVGMDYLHKNSADFARPTDPEASGPRDMKTWTAEELQSFLTFVREDRLYALWHLGAMTGMRRGELLGLRRDDLDLKEGRVSVRRALVPDGSTVNVSPPKTKRGNRVIAVDPETVAILREHLRKQKEERLAFGPGWADSGYIFTTEDGNALHPERESKSFASAVKESKMPRLTIHGLRHTHATLLLRAGVHPKVVSERLGHSTISLTMDTYSHAIPAMDADAASRMAALVHGQ